MIQGRFFATLVLLFSVNSWAGDIEQEFVPGEYLVKLNENTFRNKTFMHGDYKTVSKSGRVVLVKRPLIEQKTFAISTLQEQQGVVKVEPNYIFHINKRPNDPKLSELWGLTNDGAKGTAGMDIKAEQAWDITTGSRNVLVAVIDTGVDYTLPDLSENMWKNEAEASGLPGVDDDNNGYIDDVYGYDFANDDSDPMDDHGHGSHVSGTIGAKGEDGFGIVGVNWDVSIMALKFLSSSGGGTLEGAIKSIDYASEMGAVILNNSWGAYVDSAILKEAVERSEKAGALFVAAAGNDGRNADKTPMFPAGFDVPNVISVAALTSSGKLAWFSNYGKDSVHLAAPGSDILSITPDGYQSWSGTSMATPHVVGVAALMLAKDPSLSYQNLKDKIMDSVTPLNALDGKVVTGGLLNAFEAVK